MEFIYQNYEWLFSGIGVSIVGFIIYKFSYNNKEKGFNNTININNTNDGKTSETIEYKAKNFLTRKEDVKILFIDDNHRDFKMVSILKKSGWENTKAIKDLNDLDDIKVKESHIIFVDINGVGTQLFEDEGLGLAVALKDKYKDKAIIIYSANTVGDRFDKKLKKVDETLAKNAEPYEFISLIEEYSEIQNDEKAY